MRTLKKEKTLINVIVIAVFIIAFLVLFFFYMQPVNQTEVVKLYQQNAKVEEDFFAISEMNNIVLVPKSGEFEITFKGNGCSLVTTYDKDFKLLTQSIKDTRMLNSIWMVLLLSIAIATMTVPSVLVVMLLCFISCSFVKFVYCKIKSKLQEKVH